MAKRYFQVERTVKYYHTMEVEVKEGDQEKFEKVTCELMDALEEGEISLNDAYETLVDIFDDNVSHDIEMEEEHYEMM